MPNDSERSEKIQRALMLLREANDLLVAAGFGSTADRVWTAWSHGSIEYDKMLLERRQQCEEHDQEK